MGVNAVMHALQFYYKSMLLQMKRSRQYRFNFYMGIFGVLILYGSQFAALRVTLSFFHEVRGWNMYELAFMYGLWMLTYGILISIFAGVRDFSGLVHRGEFDVLLIRPHGLLWQVMCGRLELTSWSHIGVSSAIIIWSCHHLDFNWSFGTALEFTAIVSAGAFIQGGLLLLWAALAFWIIQAGNFVNLGWTINANYMTYPLSVYDNGIRYLFTLFPMAFITYYPAAAFLGKTDTWGYALGIYSPLVGAAFYFMMYAFWRIASKFYQSAG
jgi:ABC-2 type transport system permease protein